ncbi:hypothetical protein O181_051344 [Austropuccinia psidii MF-1]|uniref:Uncharacterized protein n=1 Tax=Austropuccinia psidii MF-1 TaxID=1389203 RepID=A0A9Q3HQM1_9BASI|nr:hypothetical protein [Austropuccinia psidii MF-1]
MKDTPMTRVTLLPAVQLAYDSSQHSTTGKKPPLLEKGWNPIFPVDYLKKNLLTIHPTAKDFHEMWKEACNTAAKCIAEAKEYNKKRWDKEKCSGSKTHRGIFQETPSISSEFSQAILPDRGGQIRLQEEEPHPPELVEVAYSPGPVKKIIKARNIRLNGKDQRQYSVGLMNQTADKDKVGRRCDTR